MNQTEFSDLLMPMKDKMFRFALSITGNRADAEDAVQDVFEKLWRKREELGGCRNVDAFTMSAVRNVCIDRIREHKMKEAKAKEIELLSDRQTHDTSGYFDIREKVDAIIARLPQKQQDIIHLRDVEGYDFDTIAEVVGMESATVRVNLSRARQKIKEDVIKTMQYGIQG